MRRDSLLLAVIGCLATAACAEGEHQDTEELGVATSAITVQEAIGSSCSTMAVRGLSLQIIAQSNCISPGAFVEIPPLSNVTMSDATFPYLEAPAKDAFVQTANDNPGMQMTVNSMLRTVAQQLLLYRWYQNGQCGIGLAASPGNSNHETGLAFDTSQYSAWRNALESHGFTWFGSSDNVHFDYSGPGAVNYKGTDVLAFQQLWNKNNPGDPIDEDGLYGPQTEARLLASPAEGFDLPVDCGPSGDRPNLSLAAEFDGATDAFADGPSAGIVDVFEHVQTTWIVGVTNDGPGPADDVVLALDADTASFDVVDYAIEVGPTPDGPFDPYPPAAEDPRPGENAGAQFQLHLGAIAAGQRKRVTLTVEPLLYSVDGPTIPELRIFVAKLDDLYAQDAFGGEVTNVDGSQTFGGGRLELAQATDVYSRTQWQWESPRLEGVTGSGLVFSTSGTTLDLRGTEEGAYIAMPPSMLVASGGAQVFIRASRTGGAGSAQLLVARDDTDFETAETITIPIADDGMQHEATIDLDPGPIERIAFVPFEQAAGNASIDYIRIEGAEAADDDDGGGGGADGSDQPADDDSDCSCDLVGGTQAPSSIAWLVAGLAWISTRRRGRAERPRSS